MSKITKDTKIGILYGGWSDEREISLESGSSVYASLKDAGYKAFLYDLKNNKEDLSKFISEYSIDIIFNLIHGAGGEDGIIQSWLDILKIRYVGSDSKSSRLSFSKTKTKEVWIKNRLPTPDYISDVELESYILTANSIDTNKDKSFDDDSYIYQEANNKIHNFLEKHDKYILKPDCSGSSVGIKIFSNFDELNKHYKSLRKDYPKNTMTKNFLEKCISGSEYTAPIIGDTIFPIIKIETKREFYDYQAKYIDDDTSFTFPNFDVSLKKDINSKCLKAFKSLGCKGWGRVDFFIDDNEVYLIEVNTIPGMTSHSLVPMSAKQKNLSYLDLILLILNT